MIKMFELFTREEIHLIKLACELFNAKFIWIDEVKYSV